MKGPLQLQNGVSGSFAIRSPKEEDWQLFRCLHKTSPQPFSPKLVPEILISSKGILGSTQGGPEVSPKLPYTLDRNPKPAHKNEVSIEVGGGVNPLCYINHH